jgi:hypothetical protein
MEEKERKTLCTLLEIKTYLFIIYLASFPHDALAGKYFITSFLLLLLLPFSIIKSMLP